MKNSLLLALLYFLIIICNQAIAGNNKLRPDGKTYNGLGCTEIANGVLYPDTPEPYGSNDVRFTAAGWAYNSSTEHTIIIACPIVRERMETPLMRAYVTMLNQTHGKAGCQLESFDKDGNFFEQSNDFKFPPSTYPETVLRSNADGGEYDFLPKFVNEHGYYQLICWLPPAERVSTNIGGSRNISYNFSYLIRYQIQEGYES